MKCSCCEREIEPGQATDILPNTGVRHRYREDCEDALKLENFALRAENARLTRALRMAIHSGCSASSTLIRRTRVVDPPPPAFCGKPDGYSCEQCFIEDAADKPEVAL